MLDFGDKKNFADEKVRQRDWKLEGFCVWVWFVFMLQLPKNNYGQVVVFFRLFKNFSGATGKKKFFLNRGLPILGWRASSKKKEYNFLPLSLPSWFPWPMDFWNWTYCLCLLFMEESGKGWRRKIFQREFDELFLSSPLPCTNHFHTCLGGGMGERVESPKEKK